MDKQRTVRHCLRHLTRNCNSSCFHPLTKVRFAGMTGQAQANEKLSLTNVRKSHAQAPRPSYLQVDFFAHTATTNAWAGERAGLPIVRKRSARITQAVAFAAGLAQLLLSAPRQGDIDITHCARWRLAAFGDGRPRAEAGRASLMPWPPLSACWRGSIVSVLVHSSVAGNRSFSTRRAMKGGEAHAYSLLYAVAATLRRRA